MLSGAPTIADVVVCSVLSVAGAPIPYVSKLISAEGGRKFWPLGGVVNPRQQGGVRGGQLEFPKSHIFSGILLFRALPSIYVHNT